MMTRDKKGIYVIPRRSLDEYLRLGTYTDDALYIFLDDTNTVDFLKIC